MGSLKCFPMVGLRGDVSVNPNKLSVVAVRMVKIVTVRRRLDKLLVGLGLSVAVMAVIGLKVALPLPVVELSDATLLNSMLLLLPWPLTLTGGSALLFVLAFAGELESLPFALSLSLKLSPSLSPVSISSLDTSIGRLV